MAVNEIWVKNYEDSPAVLTSASAVTLSDSGAAYGIRQKSDQSVLVAAGTATTEESTGYYSYDNSGSGISALSSYDSSEIYEYVFKIVRDSGDIQYVPGEIAATSANPSFSDIYSEVVTRTGNLLGNTEAKMLVNNSLRSLANDRPWSWVTDNDPYTMSVNSTDEQYTLPVTVNQVIGAYHSTVPEMTIHDQSLFAYLDMDDRLTGTPYHLMIIGNNTVMPQPKPDKAYTIHLLIRSLFNLTADSDVFPCNRDFVDAITARSCWKAASRKGKPELAQTFQEDYLETLMNLRASRIHRARLSFGDPDYA